MILKKRLVRYLVVGSIAYLVEMGTLYLLVHEVKISPVKSVAISFWVGLVVAFILQKWVAFENHIRQATALVNQLVIYGILVAWNYIFTLLAVKLFVHSASVYVIRTFAILVITSWNYVVYRALFRDTQED